MKFEVKHSRFSDNLKIVLPSKKNIDWSQVVQCLQAAAIRIAQEIYGEEPKQILVENDE